MKLVKGVKNLIEEAEREIEVVSCQKLVQIKNSKNICVIDIRDIRELWKDGRVKGSFHAPRGMLEFWVDPESPYHKEIFSSGNKFILYCKSGWRSALATKTLQDMGFGPVAHLSGGFDQWKIEIGDIEKVKQ
ncbi:MAG: rhodanese [Rhodospirillaceae bacterium]|nr:rhodanese [Rhodospirillaceae bacterium]|tara:strand:- start:1009 stop:1404 length:396 start_codon:yes stop_codon:yes gene_type:complete